MEFIIADANHWHFFPIHALLADQLLRVRSAMLAPKDLTPALEMPPSLIQKNVASVNEDTGESGYLLIERWDRH